jgi:hypothetical protein
MLLVLHLGCPSSPRVDAQRQVAELSPATATSVSTASLTKERVVNLILRIQKERVDSFSDTIGKDTQYFEEVGLLLGRLAPSDPELSQSISAKLTEEGFPAPAIASIMQELADSTSPLNRAVEDASASFGEDLMNLARKAEVPKASQSNEGCAKIWKLLRGELDRCSHPGMIGTVIIATHELCDRSHDLQTDTPFQPPFEPDLYRETCKRRGVIWAQDISTTPKIDSTAEVSRPPEIAWLVDDIPGALERGKQEHRPVFMNFTGYAEPNARWMEENVLTAPAVREKLSRFVTLMAYVDCTPPACAAQAQTLFDRIDETAIPAYLVVDPRTDALLGHFVGSTSDHAAFADFLQSAFDAYR